MKRLRVTRTYKVLALPGREHVGWVHTYYEGTYLRFYLYESLDGGLRGALPPGRYIQNVFKDYGLEVDFDVDKNIESP